MKSVTIHVSLQFDADQVTSGNPVQQARQAIDLVNLALQREPYGLGAQILPQKQFKRIIINDSGHESVY